MTALEQAEKQEPVDLSPFYCGVARIVNGEYKLADVRNVDALVNNWHPIYAIPEHHLDKLYATPPAAPVQDAIADLRRAIADDAMAASFQSLGQYRTALLKAIDTIKPAAQRQWVGLTDEERIQIYDKHYLFSLSAAISDVEAKLKEKNT